MVVRERPGIALPEYASLHKHLVDRTAELDAHDVASILDLGVAIIFHGSLEPELETVLTPLFDESVVRQLEDEHRLLADDLDLLGSLWHQEHDSPDLRELGSAILERLRHHAERDQRLFYDALERHPPVVPPARTPHDP